MIIAGWPRHENTPFNASRGCAAGVTAEAQEHRFESDAIVLVRENFVACGVLSQLQRVMDSPRFLLTGECDPVRAGDQVRLRKAWAIRCIYPHNTISPCKWTHEKALAK